MSARRISRKPVEFAPYMDRIDDYQLSIDPATGQPRYKGWMWTPAESAAVTGFRNRSDIEFPLFNNPARVNTGIKKAMKQIITDVHKYDHDSKNMAASHKLLDKVAMFGTLDDAILFNIKRGTVLASTTMTRSAAPKNITLAVEIFKLGNLLHILKIVNLDKLVKSVAKGKGTVERQIWMFIGDIEPTDMKQFTYVGSAKGGKFTQKFDKASRKKTAWYFVQEKNTHGELSPPSGMAFADVAATS